MRLLTFWQGGNLRLGVLHDRAVLDVAAAAERLGLGRLGLEPYSFFDPHAPGVEGVRRVLEAVAPRADAPELYRAEADLNFGPAVVNPEKVLCVGLNYLRHATESGMDVPGSPVLFSKFNNTLTGHMNDVPLPDVASEYDYEAELAIVIGREARGVEEEYALDHVLGYCTANDVSARDLQMVSTQWLLGKTLDKFLPLGPYLVTRDEVEDPGNLPIRCWVNGNLRQDSNTNDMIFSVPAIVSYVSRYMTLKPGDVICTGTPHGVILGRPQKDWLRPGDEVTVEVSGLGRLSNRFTAERGA